MYIIKYVAFDRPIDLGELVCEVLLSFEHMWEEKDIELQVIQIINGEMPAGIDGSFNLCDVRDLARGTSLAADKGQCGSCYILGNQEVSFKDFSRMVSQEAGCKKIKVFLPLKLATSSQVSWRTRLAALQEIDKKTPPADASSSSTSGVCPFRPGLLACTQVCLGVNLTVVHRFLGDDGHHCSNNTACADYDECHGVAASSTHDTYGNLGSDDSTNSVCQEDACIVGTGELDSEVIHNQGGVCTHHGTETDGKAADSDCDSSKVCQELECHQKHCVDDIDDGHYPLCSQLVAECSTYKASGSVED